MRDTRQILAETARRFCIAESILSYTTGLAFLAWDSTAASIVHACRAGAFDVCRDRVGLKNPVRIGFWASIWFQFLYISALTCIEVS